MTKDLNVKIVNFIQKNYNYINKRQIALKLTEI